MLSLCLYCLGPKKISYSQPTLLSASGRCLFARPLTSPQMHQGLAASPAISHHAAFQGDTVELLELTASPLRRGPVGASPARTTAGVPLSLAGNSYYAKRYMPASRYTAQGQVPSSSASTFRTGDLVVHALHSTAPRALRHMPMVDVSGVTTSFFDASEKDERYLRTLDETINTMHLHDGSEVPALRRGDVAIGRLCVLAAYVPLSTVVELRPVDNAIGALLGRRGSLSFKQDEEALQMARRLAEAYSGPRARRWRLRPVVSDDGHILSFRLT